MKASGSSSIPIRKPAWLRRRLPSGPEFERVRGLLKKGRLHTVCEEAQCPNLWECFSRRTATFLILGDTCTRNCRFCAVRYGKPGAADLDEPFRVTETAYRLGLHHVVVTSVTRDDLPDGGAGIFAETIRAVRDRIPGATVEVLIPDFQGDKKALEAVLAAGPHVLNHNLETVKRLYGTVRPEAGYARSLTLLSRVGEMTPHIPAKSGLMLGLGETPEEVQKALEDLQRAGCCMVTIGQYLQPSKKHLPVERFVPPEEFDMWKEKGLAMGFRAVASGPFVRSSYRAAELYRTATSEEEGMSDSRRVHSVRKSANQKEHMESGAQ
ncbi:MAG: lipoyl synthase [Desulfobacteraceae bacterium]|jgi:lipoyl synthase